MTALEQRIQQRNEEAERKDIDGKAGTIARYLGSSQERDDGRGTTSNDAAYHDKMFSIESGYSFFNDGGAGCGTTIKYQNHIVFNQGGGTLYSYVPGAWEKPFQKLYVKALAAKKVKLEETKKKDKEEKRKENKKLAAKFGL